MKIKPGIINIWCGTFGDKKEVFDFAGREIHFNSYNRRDDQYGWNIDHIFPKSFGGQRTRGNLICCHIITNDEKANHFPYFQANGRYFKIIQHEYYYRIIQWQGIIPDISNANHCYATMPYVSQKQKPERVLQNNQMAFIEITLYGLTNNGVLDGIINLFKADGIEFEKKDYTKIILKFHHLLDHHQSKELLKCCILLRNHLEQCYVSNSPFRAYLIFYGNYKATKTVIDPKRKYGFRHLLLNKLLINEFVRKNCSEVNWDRPVQKCIGVDESFLSIYEY